MMDNENIQKIIESCHFNFLIGSGASRNYLETLQNIEELLTDLDNESPSERLKNHCIITDVSIKYWYFQKCIKGNIKLIDSAYNVGEEKQQQFEETNANYINFLQALNVLLLKRGNKLLPKEVNIFTTNMDLFLDINLDNLGLEFNDGFNGKFLQNFNTSNYQKSFFKNSSQYSVSSELPLFNLFKLHGSLTWDKRYHGEIRYDASLATLKTLIDLEIPSEYLVSLVTDVGDKSERLKSYNEIREEAESVDLTVGVHEKVSEFLQHYDEFVMINPTKEKFENTTLRLEYYEQIRMYSNILERENTVLFVTGFSFADEHIRQITYRALNSNPTLLIVVFNFSENGKNIIENYFPNLKYNNLYTGMVGFDFKKVTESVFFKLAMQLDNNIASTTKEQENEGQTTNTEHDEGKSADSK